MFQGYTDKNKIFQEKRKMSDKELVEDLNNIYVLEEYKKDDVTKLEKLLKILESFGFSEIAVKK